MTQPNGRDRTQTCQRLDTLSAVCASCHVRTCRIKRLVGFVLSIRPRAAVADFHRPFRPKEATAVGKIPHAWDTAVTEVQQCPRQESNLHAAPVVLPVAVFVEARVRHTLLIVSHSTPASTNSATWATFSFSGPTKDLHLGCGCQDRESWVVTPTTSVSFDCVYLFHHRAKFIKSPAHSRPASFPPITHRHSVIVITIRLMRVRWLREQ